MSSDSSDDDENIELLKEAADSQFINDSMFKKNEKKENVKEKINKQTTTKTGNVEKLPSLRPNKDEFDDKMNPFHVTPAFQKHVSKKLEKLLDEEIEFIEKPKEEATTKHKKKKKVKSTVKLLKSSEVYLDPKENNVELKINQTQPEIKKRKINEEKITEEDLKKIAVTPEQVLNKEETKNWSNRSKAKVFNYKKNSKTGSLDLIEDEFR